jgi:hypothetical protein
MEGTGGDMFWQYGDELSFGKTHQDGNTVYYQDDLWKCMVISLYEESIGAKQIPDGYHNYSPESVTPYGSLALLL